MKKITNFEHFNVYKGNNSGMFVAIDHFTVGEEDWPEQFKFSWRQDIALKVCKQLNREQEKNGKCPRCKYQFKSDDEYHYDPKTEKIYCLCGHVFKKPIYWSV